MEQRIAIVCGATGLVGSALVLQLLVDTRFRAVRIFGRRSCGITHTKVEEHIIDFDQPDTWNHLVEGDVLFSALGTTLKKAGGKAAQYRVDHTYQLNIARAAAENGVEMYVLVSAAMASVNAHIFYSRMKGELERDVKMLPFPYIRIMQPGMLAGHRSETRTGERIGVAVIRFLNSIGIAKKQRPVDAADVARAMINASFDRSERIRTYTLTEVADAARTPGDMHARDKGD